MDCTPVEKVLVLTACGLALTLFYRSSGLKVQEIEQGFH